MTEPTPAPPDEGHGAARYKQAAGTGAGITGEGAFE
jgi:hypothetical protein